MPTLSNVDKIRLWHRVLCSHESMFQSLHFLISGDYSLQLGLRLHTQYPAVPCHRHREEEESQLMRVCLAKELDRKDL